MTRSGRNPWSAKRTWFGRHRHTRTVTAAVLFALCGVPDPSLAQTRKPSGEEWTQVKPLFALVEQVAAGRAAPGGRRLWPGSVISSTPKPASCSFRSHFDIVRGAFASFPVAMYVRVVGRGAPAPAPGPRDALAQYPFEDAAIVDAMPDGRISRAFTAPPGDYDVYVALAENPTGAGMSPRDRRAQAGGDGSRIPVASVRQQHHRRRQGRSRSPSDRPNFEQQLDEPYALWGTRVTPAMTTSFARSRKLSVIFLVYNAAAAEGDKPDVEVRYSIHRKTGDTESLFAATKPELFNARTLAREFSLAARRPGRCRPGNASWPASPMANTGWRSW